MAHHRLSLNQATIKYATLDEAIAVTVNAGIGGIGLWREPIAELGLGAVTARVADSGLRVSSLCRGGFFTAAEGPVRREAIEDNKRAIDETAAVAAAGAEGSAAVLVLVAGGLPQGDRDIVGARSRVRDAIGELEGYALSAGVTLALEALHPMYVADRAVLSTLGQALDIAEQFNNSAVGVVVDTFHVWWDPQLAEQIARAGAGKRIASYQVCDWLTPIAADPLLSRGMMGDGHIDLVSISRLVSDAGYRGDIEVEIFNQQIWDSPFAEVAARTADRFEAIVAP